MIDLRTEIKELSDALPKGLEKRLKPRTLASINDKVLDKNDQEIEQLIEEAYHYLKELRSDNKPAQKSFRKTMRLLKSKVRETYGYIEKGALVSEYMSIGIGIGLAFGAVFVAFNPALIAIGLPIGVAIGLGVGQQKENKADEDNKLYDSE